MSLRRKIQTLLETKPGFRDSVDKTYEVYNALREPAGLVPPLIRFVYEKNVLKISENTPAAIIPRNHRTITSSFLTILISAESSGLVISRSCFDGRLVSIAAAIASA